MRGSTNASTIHAASKAYGASGSSLIVTPMSNQGLWVNNLAPVTQTSVTPALGDLIVRGNNAWSRCRAETLSLFAGREYIGSKV